MNLLGWHVNFEIKRIPGYGGKDSEALWKEHWALAERVKKLETTANRVERKVYRDEEKLPDMGTIQNELEKMFTGRESYEWDTLGPARDIPAEYPSL